ncbi:hypothetical protein [Cupriavidus basilensis]|uniref:hypothetical protein n=1 Tax=Cupriavidus basilensis TaxID=68895 RepID=UPI0020A69622|nr:hypothetical protein [Cupriavidus basilensis]MCP3017412.1 hypothetical protein [Cupriavidus basilensis]
MFNGTNPITIHRTRYAGLGYANTNPAGKPLWRVIDLHNDLRNDRNAAVGPLYETKSELLADLDRYAKTWGY